MDKFPEIDIHKVTREDMLKEDMLKSPSLKPLKTAIELFSSVRRGDKGVDPEKLLTYMRNNYPEIQDAESEKYLSIAGQILDLDKNKKA